MLEKFRKPFKLLLFPIILLKIILFYKEEKKNKENKNDLNSRIVNKRDENIKRLVNVNYRYFLF